MNQKLSICTSLLREHIFVNENEVKMYSDFLKRLGKFHTSRGALYNRENQVLQAMKMIKETKSTKRKEELGNVQMTF